MWNSANLQSAAADYSPSFIQNILNTKAHPISIDKQRHFLAAVVDSSRDSVVTIDFDGFITSRNKAAEHLYGYPADEAIGKNLSIVVLPEDIKQLLLNTDSVAGRLWALVIGEHLKRLTASPSRPLLH